MASFNELPPEILSQIIVHLPAAKHVRDLALTCHRLHRFVEKDAWRIFALTRFPSISIPPHWKDGAHALTTLSRNLDRRAFIANEVGLNKPILCLPEGNVIHGWREKPSQSMGYQAMVDSHEVWTGGDWKSRKEVVAWGAGADLVLKTITRNRDSDREFFRHPRERGQRFEHALGRVKLLKYKDKSHLQGRDDITAVKILRSESESNLSYPDVKEEVVVGRASGNLSLLRLCANSKNCVVKQYATSDSHVRSMDLNPSQTCHLAACLDDDTIALYPLRSTNELIQPTSKVGCVSKNERCCRTWGSRFISTDLFAVARGPSSIIVEVYQLRDDGLSEAPLRAFGSGRTKSNTSAYPVIGVPSSGSNTPCGSLLLSGGYDGFVRLHDLRSPKNYETMFQDPVTHSSVYSLATIGREQVIVGAAGNSIIKIFDSRMLRGRAYSYCDASSAGLAATTDPAPPIDNDRSLSAPTPDVEGESGWAIFCKTTSKSSPVYSLSRPSPSSASLYVGLENQVSHINFTSLLDEHPDPLFRLKPKRRGTQRDSIGTWRTTPRDLHNLAFYEFSPNPPFRMFAQKDPHDLRGAQGEPQRNPLPGYDERLVEIR